MKMRLTAGTMLLVLLGAAQAQPAASDAEEAAAAMRRAERLAANPMRIIQQAGKIGRRDTTALLAAAAAPDTAPAAAPAQARAAASGKLQSLLLLAAPPPALPPLAREYAALELAVPAALLQPVATRLQPENRRPRLVSKVDPAIPQSLRLASGRVNTVQVDLTLRTDGTVSDVVLVPPVPRSWQRYLREALVQWRFDPLHATAVHRVQLVFEEL